MSDIEERAASIVDAQNAFGAQRGRGETFTAMTVEEATSRLANSDPSIGGFGWSLSAPPGGVVIGRAVIIFPEPTAVPAESNLYLHVWVGSGNVDPDLGSFLRNVDPRFPRLSEPRVPGLRPGLSQVPEFPAHPDTALLAFELRVPFEVEQTVYLGNMCLMQRSPYSVGAVLGRASFAFRVRGVDEPPDLAGPP